MIQDQKNSGSKIPSSAAGFRAGPQIPSSGANPIKVNRLDLDRIDQSTTKKKGIESSINTFHRFREQMYQSVTQLPLSKVDNSLGASNLDKPQATKTLGRLHTARASESNLLERRTSRDIPRSNSNTGLGIKKRHSVCEE